MSTDSVSTPTNVEVFTFGDPTPVLETQQIYYWQECWTYNKWYDPPRI